MHSYVIVMSRSLVEHLLFCSVKPEKREKAKKRKHSPEKKVEREPEIDKPVAKKEKKKNREEKSKHSPESTTCYNSP